MLVGRIDFKEYQKDIIESNDNREFICTDKEKNQFQMQIKDLEDWALLLNSPWSQSTFGYKIELNCKDGYTEMQQSDPRWRCIYYTIGYQGITTTCIGYGDTEENALKECRNLFNYLQKEYNKDDEFI